jgi:hypothetical protein
LRDVNNFILLRNFNQTAWNFTFSTEVAPFFQIRFFPGLFLKVSYEMLYFEKVVLAPLQLGFRGKSGSAVNHHGRAIYHGGFGGLVLSF